MALEIPPKQMAGYQATAQRRLEEKRRNLALHYQRACKVVQQASHLLKKEFGARQNEETVTYRLEFHKTTN